jgi:hypothetical protein
VAFGCGYLAIQRRLVSEARGLSALPAPFQAVKAFDLTRLGRALPLIGEAFPVVISLLARVCDAVTRVGGSIARIGNAFSPAHDGLALVERGPTHLGFDLLRLDVGVPVLRERRIRPT